MRGDVDEAKRIPDAIFVREMLKIAFAAGWDAAKRDESAADEEDIADAPDVAFCEWMKAIQ